MVPQREVHEMALVLTVWAPALSAAPSMELAGNGTPQLGCYVRWSPVTQVTPQLGCHSPCLSSSLSNSGGLPPTHQQHHYHHVRVMPHSPAIPPRAPVLS